MIALLVVGREVWVRIRNLQWPRLAAAGVVFFGVPVVDEEETVLSLR
jgi:hypothetical protein